MSPSTLLTLYIALWAGVLGAVLGSFLDCAAGRPQKGAAIWQRQDERSTVWRSTRPS